MARNFDVELSLGTMIHSIYKLKNDLGSSGNSDVKSSPPGQKKFQVQCF